MCLVFKFTCHSWVCTWRHFLRCHGANCRWRAESGFRQKTLSNKLSLCRSFALETSKSFNRESKIVVDKEEKCRWKTAGKKASLHPSFVVGERNGVVPVACCLTWLSLCITGNSNQQFCITNMFFHCVTLESVCSFAWLHLENWTSFMGLRRLIRAVFLILFLICVLGSSRENRVTTSVN